MPTPILIALSDDLTGAAAAGAEAVRGGGTADVVAWDRIPATSHADVLVIDTNSRLLPEAEAVARIHAVTTQTIELFGEHVVMYKRVDSLLRGNTAAEVRAWRAAVQGPAILAPAAPSYGVITRDGQQLRGGAPIEVASGGDPDVARVHPKGLLAAAPIAVDQLRSGDSAGPIGRQLTDGLDVMCDAESCADLTEIAHAARTAQRSGIPVAMVGSYGLLGAWMRAGRRHRTNASGGTIPGSLVIATSYQPATIAQLDELARTPGVEMYDAADGDADAVIAKSIAALRNGRDIVLTTNLPGHVTPAPRPEAAHSAARMAVAIIQHVRPTGLVLLGGEGSSAVIRMLAAVRITVVSEPWSATPLVQLTGGPHDGLTAIIQSGSQGEPTRTLHALDLLAAYVRHGAQADTPMCPDNLDTTATKEKS